MKLIENWHLTIAKMHPAWGLALLGLIHLMRVAQLRQAVGAAGSMIDQPSSAISQALTVGMPRLPLRRKVDLLLGCFDDCPLAAVVVVAQYGVQIFIGTFIVSHLILSFIKKRFQRQLLLEEVVQVIHQWIIIGLCGHFTDLWGVRLFEVTVLPECSDCYQRPSWQGDHLPAGGNRSHHQEVAHDNGQDRGEELAVRVQVV